MNTTTLAQQNDQHSLIKSLLLHISSGILVTVVFLLLRPLSTH